MLVLQCVINTRYNTFDPQLYFLPTRVVFIAVFGTNLVHRCRRTAVFPIAGPALSATILASIWIGADLRCTNCCLLHIIWSILRNGRACRNLQEF